LHTRRSITGSTKSINQSSKLSKQASKIDKYVGRDQQLKTLLGLDFSPLWCSRAAI
jgi:hypothetical protein